MSNLIDDLGPAECWPNPDRPYPNLGPVIDAQYPGECSECMAEISPGEEIRADGFGNWIHAECAAMANGG